MAQDKALLLQHLNTQRFLSVREKRELQMRTEFALMSTAPPSELLGQLQSHIKSELIAAHLPVPKTREARASDQADGLQTLLEGIAKEPDEKKRLNELTQVVRRLVRHEGGVDMLSQVHGERMLVSLLGQSPQPELLAIYAALSAYPSSRKKFYSALPPSVLADFLKSPDGLVREHSANILANYASEMRAAIPLSAISPLLELISGHDDDQQGFQALRAIANLSLEEQHRRAIADANAHNALTKLLSARHADTAAMAAWAIAHLAPDAPALPALALPVLAELLQTCSDNVAYHALRAITNLIGSHTTPEVPRLSDSVVRHVDSSDTAVQAEALRTTAQMVAQGHIKEGQLAESVALACVALIDQNSGYYDDSLAVPAAWCLAHLATALPDVRTSLLDLGVLELLASQLEVGSASARLPIVWALCGFAENARQKFRDLDLIEPLAAFLFNTDEDLTVAAARALSSLSHDDKNKKLIGQLYQKFAVQDPVVMARAAKDTRGKK